MGSGRGRGKKPGNEGRFLLGPFRFRFPCAGAGRSSLILYTSSIFLRRLKGGKTRPERFGRKEAERNGEAERAVAAPPPGAASGDMSGAPLLQQR